MTIGFLKRLLSRKAEEEDAIWIHVRCGKCGEGIKSRVDLRHDLTPRYGEGGNVTSYFLRKVLIGSGRCFQPIEVKLTFDANRNIISREITGGDFIAEGQEREVIPGI
jgi:hypothetical protein